MICFSHFVQEGTRRAYAEKDTQFRSLTSRSSPEMLDAFMAVL